MIIWNTESVSVIKYQFYIMSIITVWYEFWNIHFWINGCPLWKTQNLLLEHNTGSVHTLVPFFTGSHLSLRMWFGGQPNRPLEGRRAVDQVFTTPGLKTASMRTSVSDSENAKPHVIHQILLSRTVENMSALTFLLLYSFFSYILSFKFLGSEFFFFL